MYFKHINIYEHQFWNAIDNDNEIMRRDIAMSNKLSYYKAIYNVYFSQWDQQPDDFGYVLQFQQA